MIKKKERNQNIWADNSENNKPMLYWRAQRSLELQANNGLGGVWPLEREAEPRLMGMLIVLQASVWSLKKNHHHFEWGKTLMALSGRCRPAWTRLRPDCRHPAAAAAAHCETHSHRRSPPNTHQTQVPLGEQTRLSLDSLEPASLNTAEPKLFQMDRLLQEMSWILSKH